MPCVVSRIGCRLVVGVVRSVRYSTVWTYRDEFLASQQARIALNSWAVPVLSRVTTLLVLHSLLVFPTLATLYGLKFKRSRFPRLGTRSCEALDRVQRCIKLITGAAASTCRSCY